MQVELSAMRSLVSFSRSVGVSRRGICSKLTGPAVGWMTGRLGELLAGDGARVETYRLARWGRNCGLANQSSLSKVAGARNSS